MILSFTTTMLEILICTIRKKTWTMASRIRDAMHRTRMTMVPMKKLMRKGSRPMRPKLTTRYWGAIIGPLFRDLSLADEATVDGGKGIVLKRRPTSY
jgi:hypothetical protein